MTILGHFGSEIEKVEISGTAPRRSRRTTYIMGPRDGPGYQNRILAHVHLDVHSRHVQSYICPFARLASAWPALPSQ